MTNGAIAVTAAASVLVAADEHRGEIVLQFVSGSPTYLSFGDDVPVVGSGIILSDEFPAIVVRGTRAMGKVNGICDTALTAVGAYSTDPEAIIVGVRSGKAAADAASVIYDGGGTGNDLVEYATGALLIAALAGMDVIDCDGKNAIDIQLGNSVAAQSCTLLVSEYSAAAPTVATQIRATEIEVGVADCASTVDRVIFGLATGTEIPVKVPIRLAVTPGSFVLISLADDLAGGLWYARYQLHGSV